MEEKIKAINSYLEIVGSSSRYKNLEDKCYINYDIDAYDDFSEVPETYINDVYEHLMKKVKTLAEKFGLLR